jgi:hypothetical protein
MCAEMTPKEMLQMRLNGATYQEIADTCGITRQAAHQAVRLYANKISSKRRGREFFLEEIKFEGIYEHFVENEEETVTSFAKSIFGGSYSVKVPTMRNFLRGETNSFFSISQIKRMCEICGKPFEDVFKERKGGDQQ